MSEKPRAKIEIRPATARDLGEVVRMHALLMEDQASIGWRESWPADVDRRAYFLGRITNPEVFIILAFRDGEIAGYTHASILPPPRVGLQRRVRRKLRTTLDRLKGQPSTPPPRVGYSHNTYVLPDHRRFGLARKLLVASVDAMRSAGATTIRAHVLARNPGMHTLLMDLGFAPLNTEYQLG